MNSFKNALTVGLGLTFVCPVFVLSNQKKGPIDDSGPGFGHLGNLIETTSKAVRPNILVIVSDDQGFCELGAYMDFADPDKLGARNPEQLRSIKTLSDQEAPIEVCFEAARRCMPNVDKLAAFGMRFTSFYAAPTCAPSRAAMMTARYPQRFGVYSNDDVEGKFGKGLPSEVELPVKLFQQAGYLTGLVGKWHLGVNEGQHPNERGFDYYFGFNRAHTEKYGSKILYRNTENVPADGWLADQTSDEAIIFLKRAQQENRPFFLKVSYNEPHGPTPRPPQKYIDYINSGSDVVDVYYASIYGMDYGIGRILEQLKTSGQMENTLILYLSDNGLSRSSYFGFRARNESYGVPVPGNGPLSGCKWTAWDGGVRVPCIAVIPNGMKGVSSDALLSVMDILPTSLDYAGIDIPESYQLDGQSFLPVLRGMDTATKERVLFWACDSQEPFGNFTPEYDVLRNNLQNMGPQEIRAAKYPPSWYVRTDKWKLMGWDALPPVLIDIRNDIGENYDLSAQYPEVVKQLSGAFQSWFVEMSPPIVYPMYHWNKFRMVE